jgi:hypothetical protein
MKKNYEKVFKNFKDYIKINSEGMKVDFDLFSSKLAMSNIGSLVQGLDEKSAKNIFVENLKSYKELKKQRRLIAQNKKKKLIN